MAGILMVPPSQTGRPPKPDNGGRASHPLSKGRPKPKLSHWDSPDLGRGERQRLGILEGRRRAAGRSSSQGWMPCTPAPSTPHPSMPA